MNDDNRLSGGQVGAQVDDFPRLIEQMRQKAIAANLLENVVDFASLIQKLLVITHTALCVFKDPEVQFQSMPTSFKDPLSRQQDQDPIPLLV